MKRIFSLLTAAVVFLLFAAQGFPLDFGGTVDNDSSLTKKEDSEFIQENKLLFWLASVGERYTFNFAISGTYTTEKEKPTLFADVERLSLRGVFPNLEEGPSLFAFEVGRFFESEFSTRVFAHSLDGIGFDFGYPGSSGRLVLGYTGLINKNYASILLSKADATDDADDDVIFASPRFVGSLSWEFPDIFARQTLNLAIIAQEDLRHLFEDTLEEGRETQDPTRGGRVDTQYVGVGLSGPLMRSLYYDTYFYLGTGRMLTFTEDTQSSTGESYRYENILSFLFGGSVRYYLPEFFQSAFAVKFIYAGGDLNSTAYVEGNASKDYTGFLPIAGQTFGLVFTPKSSNIFAAELNYSMKPFGAYKGSALESLQTSVMLTPFFKPVKGAMSEAEVDPAGNAGYLGTELAAAVNYRPFSDLGMSLSLGVFLPGSGAFLPGKDDPWFTGKFLFSFSF